MNNANMVFLEAGSRDLQDLAAALTRATEGNRHIRIEIAPAYVTPIFDKGDIVRVPADSGLIYARVDSEVGDGYVKVRYQGMNDTRPIEEVPLDDLPYSTSLHRTSVRTTHNRQVPAVLKWKVGEGGWTPPIRSHRENGGY